jgi:two-component system response regulator LytT
MKILIVEDEKPGAERLEKLLASLDTTYVVAGVCQSIKSTVKWLQENPAPDLILMDIELSDGQCFGIFNQFTVTSPVIFTTSYDEYALQAFKVNSIDYLLKPVKSEELEQSLKKLRQLREQLRGTSHFNINNLLDQLRKHQHGYRSRFLVRQGSKLISVDIAEIAYFYAEDRLTFFRTWSNSRYVVDYTLEELEHMLNPEHFYRISRSYITHLKSIAEINNYFNGKLRLELDPRADKEVVISRENAMDFKIWMGK